MGRHNGKRASSVRFPYVLVTTPGEVYLTVLLDLV